MQPALSVSSEKRARLGHALPRSREVGARGVAAAARAYPRQLARISLKQILRLGRSMLVLALACLRKRRHSTRLSRRKEGVCLREGGSV